MYYECHVTIKCPEENISALESLIEKDAKWAFSRIEGDIILGEGVKCYATQHFEASMSFMEVLEKLRMISKMIAFYGEVEVIREKIELVMYDTKQKKAAESF